MTTTTKLGDFLGRALVNDTPGTSAATDYLGRAVTASNKDFIGRALVDTPSYPPPTWAVATAYALAQRVKLAPVAEVQSLTSTGTPTGNLKLAVDGVPTADIATVNAANVQSALVALPNVEPGDVVVTGSASPWTLTWKAALGNVPQVSVDNSDVDGGTYAVTTATQGSEGGEVLEATVAGTSHASVKPTAPAVGATVTDGTVTWKRLK
jgi:hypothetical protein